MGNSKAMIVSPNFPDHWKTRMLVGLLNDPTAPLCIIRLWGHCQQQKSSEFHNLSAEALKAICFYTGDSSGFLQALETSGFIRTEDGHVIVHQWEEYNSTLIASWKNGPKGGRPKNPIATQEKPTDNPRVMSGVTDREDKRRLDGIEKIEKNASPSGNMVSFPKKDPILRRVETLFKRREGTIPSPGENRAYVRAKAMLEQTPEDEWQLLEWFYGIPSDQAKDLYRRTDLASLMNNWHAEIHKARQKKATMRQVEDSVCDVGKLKNYP